MRAKRRIELRMRAERRLGILGFVLAGLLSNGCSQRGAAENSSSAKNSVPVERSVVVYSASTGSSPSRSSRTRRARRASC